MDSTELQAYCEQIASDARAGARALAHAPSSIKDLFLRDAATRIRSQESELLLINQRDLDAAPSFDLSAAQVDRLKLTPQRIEAIAAGLEAVAALDDPIGEIIESQTRPNGLKIQKTRVPLGVVFFVYESRPNVTTDAAAICLKSGNAVILRGGKEAVHTSTALVNLLWQSMDVAGISRHALGWVETRNHDAVGILLGLSELIDVAIPRGGISLIQRVANEAKMPVIKHFSGNCHIFVDSQADLDMATAITINAKCQRPGVCNACESLLVHHDIADQWLPDICDALETRKVEIRGDQKTKQLVPSALPATEVDYATEYLDDVISIKVVSDLPDAIAHINHYGSGHSDAIITGSSERAEQFAREVDSAAVFINASTRFHDGSEFGLGVEIGISTGKFHARGPCGLRELTSYKYIVFGKGEIRD